MGYTDRSRPPTEWCDWWSTPVTMLTPDIGYGWHDDEPDPHFWHWCSHLGRWMAAGTENHQLLSHEPLHLEPSLLWRCCNTHGWVRNGQWINA